MRNFAARHGAPSARMPLVVAFASARARRQVERLIDYVAFPGLGLIVEPNGRVLVERGEVPGVVAPRLTRALVDTTAPDEVGVVLDAQLLSTDALPTGYYVMSIALRDGVRLCVVIPNAVSAGGVQPRLLRARERLVKMMAPGPGGADGASAEANALWIFASLPTDPLE